MRWPIRVIKLSVLGRLPFGDGLRRLKRQWFGYEPDPRNLRDTLDNLGQMRAALGRLDRSFKSATILEIGSGWFPTIPIMLCVEGAGRVLMTDLNVHMDEVTFATTLKFLKNEMPTEKGLQGKEAIGDFPIKYLAPFKLADVPDGSLDYVISRTVLEHIMPSDLESLLAALRPKLSKSGLMVHLVDHSDHLEHSDRSISKVNFLTWSARKHALVNWLTKEGESRLRHHEYLPLFERAGYEVLSATSAVHEETLKRVPSLPLVMPYADMTAEQISTLASLYVCAVQAN